MPAKTRSVKRFTVRKPAAKPLSIGESTLELQLKVYKAVAWEREYVFAPDRKYRFDFAWPDRMIAVEVEGGTFYGKSRHGSGTGFENDCRKYNLAAMLGWTVLRFTTRMVSSGEAIDELRQLLCNLPIVC